MSKGLIPSFRAMHCGVDHLLAFPLTIPKSGFGRPFILHNVVMHDHPVFSVIVREEKLLEAVFPRGGGIFSSAFDRMRRVISAGWSVCTSKDESRGRWVKSDVVKVFVDVEPGLPQVDGRKVVTVHTQQED